MLLEPLLKEIKLEVVDKNESENVDTIIGNNFAFLVGHDSEARITYTQSAQS